MKNITIQNLNELSEEQKDNIVFGIMNYKPSIRVRDRILEEVFKFKWIDCENHNINIYETLSPENQLISAGFEWRVRHWEEFFATNDTDGIDQPRKLK